MPKATQKSSQRIKELQAALRDARSRRTVLLKERQRLETRLKNVEEAIAEQVAKRERTQPATAESPMIVRLLELLHLNGSAAGHGDMGILSRLDESYLLLSEEDRRAFRDAIARLLQSNAIAPVSKAILLTFAAANQFDDLLPMVREIHDSLERNSIEYSRQEADQLQQAVQLYLMRHDTRSPKTVQGATVERRTTGKKRRSMRASLI